MTQTRSRRMAGVLSSTQIAKLCDVQLSVVSNWKKRYPNFPEPVDQFNGSDVYDRKEVVNWLRDLASQRLDSATKTLDSAKQTAARAEARVASEKANASRIRKIRA